MQSTTETQLSPEAQAQIGQLLAAELQRLGATGDITQIEQTLRVLLQQAGQAAVQQTLEHQDRQIAREPHTLRAWRVHSRRAATLWTSFGKVTYRRRYYYRRSAQGARTTGAALLDQRLRLQPGQVTPTLAGLLALMGVNAPFLKAARLVERFLLFPISENTLRKETERFGKLLQGLEQTWLAQSQDPHWLQTRQREGPPGSGRLYASIDGGMVPFEDGWHELKAVTWYRVTAGSVAPNAPEAPPLQAHHITYHCDRLPAEDFGLFLWATGCQRDADRAEELVFVCDGAAWIWRLVDTYYPHAVQIVDWYHAVAYLAEVARALYPTEKEKAQREAWLAAHEDILWWGQVDNLLWQLEPLTTHPTAGEAARRASTYYQHNQHRMDYARYREEGYFIGSGTVESGLKQIVALRLKEAGARWSLTGGVATAKARAAWLSGDWDTLVELRETLPLAV